MTKEAVLLKPGDHLDGTFQFVSNLFDLKPGAYRIEASVTGWTEGKFTNAEGSELTQVGSPFMVGEVSDSIRIKLKARTK